MGAETRFKREAVRKFENYVSRVMQSNRIPGLSVSVTDRENTFYERGFGVRDMDNSLPATSETLYGIGSVTKSFTALAVLQLVEKRKISLDSKVADILPEFSLDADSARTNILHLLTHSIGIPSLNAAEISLFRLMKKDNSFIPMNDFDDFEAFLNNATEERVEQPGKKFFYWNEGYTLLGRIIEKVSEMPFTEYMERNILRPLRMTDSSFSRDRAISGGKLSSFYDDESDGQPIPVPFPENELVYAPGGLISNVLDLAKYLRFWLNSGKVQNNQFVSETTIRSATKPRILTGVESQFGSRKYACGWEVYPNFFDESLVIHSGSIGISTAAIAFLPSSGIGVAVASNTGSTPTVAISEYLLSILKERDPETELEQVKIDETIRKMAGSYHDFRNYTYVEIALDKDGFFAMSILSDEMKVKFPLFFDEGKIYAVVDHKKYPMEFSVKEDGTREILFERHRFTDRH